jgi:uncharacterized membrane protein YdjX (TVP38/TMEM64 family)
MANPAPRTDSRRGGWRTALPLLLLILLGVGLWVSGLLDRVEPSQLASPDGGLRGWVQAHPWESRGGFALFLALAIATGLPGTIVIVLAGGLVFGTWQGTALSSVALVAGSLVLYAASRHAFAGGRRQPPAFAERMRERYARNPVAHTFALRFVPVVPLGAMTLTLAWLRCPVWLFTVATWAGGTVSVAIESAIGAGLAHTIGKGPVTASSLANARLLVPLGLFVVIALLPTVVKAIRRQRD